MFGVSMSSKNYIDIKKFLEDFSLNSSILSEGSAFSTGDLRKYLDDMMPPELRAQMNRQKNPEPDIDISAQYDDMPVRKELTPPLPYAKLDDPESAEEKRWRQEYHREQDRLSQQRADDASLWEEQLDELTNKLLQKYKTAAALDAGAADRIAFDPSTDKETANKKIKQANKRFSGIVKATKKQFANDAVKEGSMGGINRSAPAQDVSYEKVLDDDKEYHETHDIQKFVVVDIQTGEIVAGPYTDRQIARNRRDKLDLKHGSIRYRVEPVRKMIERKLEEKKPCWKGYKQIGMKDKGGKEVPNCVPVNEAPADDDEYRKKLNKILANQAKKSERKDVVPIPYHGWTIKYRPADTGPINWVIIDKDEIKERGQAPSEREAVAAAQRAIDDKIGVGREAVKTVNIDFNRAWSNQFSPEGEHWYVSFLRDDSGPVLLMSTEPQSGFKKTDSRRDIDQHVTLRPKESNELGFQPNGRYILGPAEDWDENTKMYRLTLHSIVQDKEDRLRLKEPSITVAHGRP